MLIQQEIEEFVARLEKVPDGIPILFEAHYWGTFALERSGFAAAPQSPSLFAKATSYSHPRQLLFDPGPGGFILQDPDNPPLLIATTLTEFFGDATTIEHQLSQSNFHFDQRQSLAQLLPPDSFLLTAINDPEYFEEIEAYYELLRFIEQLTGLSFDHISGQQDGDDKVIQLHKGQQSWTIHLHKALFDNEIIVQFNQVLIDCGIVDYSLSSTVNEEMQMVLLKLGPEERDLLQRMGLLI